MMARHRLVRRSFSGGGRVLRALALTSLVGLSGCARGCTSSRPPIHINPSMLNQPKVLPQTASDFFYNGASMRPPVPGTVPIGGLKEDAPFFTGKGADRKPVATIPLTVDAALLERGRQRYGIYCQPCHDARGDGKGILFTRGNRLWSVDSDGEGLVAVADGGTPASGAWRARCDTRSRRNPGGRRCPPPDAS